MYVQWKTAENYVEPLNKYFGVKASILEKRAIFFTSKTF